MPRQTTSPKLLKSINQQKVLRLIYTEGPISRVELAQLTGLTTQTVTNIVNRLLDDDIIAEAPDSGTAAIAATTGGGRRPVPLTVKCGTMYAIGIEVAVQYVRGSLMDFHNRCLQEVLKPVHAHRDEEETLLYIGRVIDELLQHVPDRERLQGIGCSIQGLVDTVTGTVIRSPGLNWRQFPLKKRLEEKYGLPVYLENDANLLAVVENLNGALSASEHNLTFKFDYGIGGAIVLNGQLCSGASHVAGEFGHIKAFSGADAHKCHCGASGCLTTLASVSGLRRNVKYTLDEFDTRLRSNDQHAAELFATIEAAISRAVGNAITLFNPDHVLFTGKLIDQFADTLIPMLKEHIAETVPESCRGVKLVFLSQTPNESVSAAGLVMNHYFDVPLGSLSL